MSLVWLKCILNEMVVILVFVNLRFGKGYVLGREAHMKECTCFNKST